ncbi:MAG: tetratricopeptide repeat protein [Acidobacteriota bacterium]|nr:tetratricopeptide repeat protein [Acidobacteriota bacterium]
MFVLILISSLAIQPFTIQGFFAVFGTIRDEEGRVVSSVRVSLLDENYQPKGTAFSDSSGHYQFRNLRAGSYYLRVEPTGLPYEEYSKQIDLYSMTRRSSTYEEPTLEDIVLKPKKSPTTRNSKSPGVIFVQVIPPAARGEYHRGASSIKDKNSQLGIEALKKAIEIFPYYFDALELLGTQYVKLGLTQGGRSREQFENAIPILTRALAINNKAALSMYFLGLAYLKLNQLNDSIAWLQNATAQDGSNPHAYLWLGLAYGNFGSLDQSELALKKAYELGRANVPEAHLYLAGIYNKRERYLDASRELELYLKEAKGLKDKTQIKEMIVKLKAKDKTRQ